MGGGMGSNFGNTKGSKITLLKTNTKASALQNVSTLPGVIQKTVKSFIKGSSNNYNSYSVQQKSDGSYVVKMENPGKVPGSKAIYYKLVDEIGQTIRVYKETFDPAGELVHTKEK